MRRALAFCLILAPWVAALGVATVKVDVSGTNRGTLTANVTGARTVTWQDLTTTLVGRDTTDTLTKKTLDVEDTGNNVTVLKNQYIHFVNNFNAVAYHNVNGSTDQPGNGGVAQTNTWPDLQRLLFDPSSVEEISATTVIPPSADLADPVDIRLFWGPTNGSCGANCGVRYCLKLACGTPGSDTADLGSLEATASCQNLTASTTANMIQATDYTAMSVTGCVAGDLLTISLYRSATNILDSYASDSAAFGLQLTFRSKQ